MKLSPQVYGDAPQEVPQYKSIAYYIEEGQQKPRI